MEFNGETPINLLKAETAFKVIQQHDQRTVKTLVGLTKAFVYKAKHETIYFLL